MARKEMQNLKSKVAKIFLDKVETLECVRDKDGFQRFVNNLKNFMDEQDKATEDYHCILSLLGRLRKSGDISPREHTLLEVFLYLMMVEGPICSYLNFFSHLLVASEHDLYSLTKRKYVKDDMDEIRKVEMSTKIQFLKHHGFGVLTKEYDSTFRNDIAHHNYWVDAKGFLWIRGKAVDMTTKLDSLIRILHFARESFEEVGEKLAQRRCMHIS